METQKSPGVKRNQDGFGLIIRSRDDVKKGDTKISWSGVESRVESGDDVGRGDTKVSWRGMERGKRTDE